MNGSIFGSTGSIAWGLVVASLIVGCGSSVEDDGGGGGGGGTGGSGGGSGGVCEELMDVEPAQSATFTIRNESGIAAYFPTGCASVEGVVRMGGDAPPTDLTFPWQTGCAPTCEDYQSEQGPPVCDACNSGLLRIETGTSVSFSWTAVAFAARDMPGTCTPDGQGIACEQVVDAPTGTYELELTAHTDCPDCTCDDTGRCQGEPGGQSSTIDTAFLLPAGGDVEVLLPNCFFGCAEG